MDPQSEPQPQPQSQQEQAQPTSFPQQQPTGYGFAPLQQQQLQQPTGYGFAPLQQPAGYGFPQQQPVGYPQQQPVGYGYPVPTMPIEEPKSSFQRTKGMRITMLVGWLITLALYCTAGGLLLSVILNLSAGEVITTSGYIHIAVYGLACFLGLILTFLAWWYNRMICKFMVEFTSLTFIFSIYSFFGCPKKTIPVPLLIGSIVGWIISLIGLSNCPKRK